MPGFESDFLALGYTHHRFFLMLYRLTLPSFGVTNLICSPLIVCDLLTIMLNYNLAARHIVYMGVCLCEGDRMQATSHLHLPTPEGATPYPANARSEPVSSPI